MFSWGVRDFRDLIGFLRGEMGGDGVSGDDDGFDVGDSG